jgi:flagellin-like hook-associated protein FlgL
MRLFHQRGCFISVGGTLSEFTPTAITGTTQFAGTATTVEAALPASYDAVKHRWFITTTDALYTTGTEYEIEWSVTRAGTTYAVTEYYVHYTPTTADTTGPGAASVAVIGADDTSITVAVTPPTDADYDHYVVYAIPKDGSILTAVPSSAATVNIAGLPSGEDGWVVVVAFDTSGNPGSIGVSSVADWQTMPAAVPTYPLYVEHYFDDESVPYATETLDQEGDGAQRLAGAGACIGSGRRYRVRVYTFMPVTGFELRGIDLLMQTRPGQPGGLRNALGNR